MAANAENAVTLGDISEGEILARVFPRLPVSSNELLGPGDDAAVISAPDGRFVVTTDMIVEGPDFRTEWSTPFEIGFKAAAINLADVAAMGAIPTALVVALGAPAETPVEHLEQIADGMRAACERLAPGCGVAGGDLSSAPALVLSIAAHGDLEGRAPLTRSAARSGDVIAVAGELGLAGVGLELLFELGSDARVQHAELIRAQLAPEPHIGLGRVAARAGAHAAMDISDGLAIDASRMALASNVRFDLSGDAIHDCVKRLNNKIGIEAGLVLSVGVRDLFDLVLYSGESHALLVTFPADVSIPGGFVPIGVVSGLSGDEPGVFVDGASVEPRGWHAFRASSD